MIVTFSDIEYADTLFNWIAYIEKLNLPYLVIALDQRILNLLQTQKINVKSIEEFEIPNKVGIWTKRVIVFKKLAEDGIDFIASDTDALWLDNPMHLFESESDIVASQGTNSPKVFFKKHQFVMCMGLMKFKANNKTLNVLTDMLEMMGNDKEDQRCLNECLIEATRIENKLIVPRYDIEVSLIDRTLVARLPQHKTDETLIYHPLSPKKNEAKKSAFKKEGLYLLEENWLWNKIKHL